MGNDGFVTSCLVPRLLPGQTASIPYLPPRSVGAFLTIEDRRAHPRR